MPIGVVSNLGSTAGIVAIAAGVVAVIAVCTSALMAVSVRRLRAAQRVVLGDGRHDIVDHAASLQTSHRALAEYVQASVAGLAERVAHAEHRLDGTIGHRALVRYDAYDEMSGRQSLSIALLDATGSGFVLSSIQHRDAARLYAKQVSGGKGEIALSPEEQQAVTVALSGVAAAGSGG